MLTPEAAPAAKPRAIAEPRLRFIEAYTWMFESPQWFLNFLLVALLANFLPIIGQIVAFGYLFACVEDQIRSPRFGYVDLDLNKFVEYLKRGVWPWVVQFVSSILGIPFAMVCYFPLFFYGLRLIQTRDEMWSLLGGLVIGISYVIYIFIIILINVAPIPLIFRVGITGNMKDAFQFRWAFSYLRKLFPELFLLTMMTSLISLPLVFIGFLACFIGLWFIASLLYFAGFRLLHQLYDIFLARGGEPIPLPLPPAPPPPMKISIDQISPFRPEAG
jgi:Protein of unknown function (DUF4013)